MLRPKLIPLAAAAVTLLAFFGSVTLYHFGFLDPRYRPTSYPSLHQPHSPILILQHAVPKSGPGELVHASVEGHQRYAAARGYKYVVDHTDYVNSINAAAASMNKIHLLLRVAIAELAEGTVDWIMMVDADALIADPSIALEDFLPWTELSPTPLLLGNRDHAGFNAGVLLFQVDQDLIILLSRILACADDHQRKGEYVSDQRCFAEVLQEHPELSRRFYEVPQHWWNGYCGELYHLDEVTNLCTDIREVKPPALHVHFVANQKKNVDWKQTVQHAEGIWREMFAGKLDRSRSREAQSISSEWWRNAKGGVETMTWSKM